MRGSYGLLAIQAAGLGAATGMRSTVSPALLSGAMARGELGGFGRTPLALLGSRRVSRLLALMVLGELAADKVPGIPGRTAPFPLLGRMFAGAFSGYALFVSCGRGGRGGAALGGLSAVASAYATYHLRRGSTQRLGVPDPVCALAEDAVALAVGLLVLRSVR